MFADAAMRPEQFREPPSQTDLAGMPALRGGHLPLPPRAVDSQPVEPKVDVAPPESEDFTC